MSRPLLIGIDLGGSGARCLLVDAARGTRHAASRNWRFPPAAGTAGMGFDLDLASMWARIGEASRDALTRASARPGEVVGVAVCAIRFGTVLLDHDGDVILAVPNRDARAALQGIQLAAEHGDAILGETGFWPLPVHAAARLLWLAAERPDALGRTHHVLSMSDWLNLRLSGVAATDPSQAGCSGLFDLASGEWSWDWIDRLGLPRAPFVEAPASGTTLGGLSPVAARHLGLASWTPVVLGGADSQCGLLGCGAILPSDVAVIGGTTTPVQMVIDKPLLDCRGRIRGGHHVVPDRWVLESNCGPMGESLTWFARLLYGDCDAPESRLLADAAEAETGSAGMLSTLGAEVANDRSLQIPVGHLALTHLTSQHDPAPRRHLARALIEGHACAVRANLEQLIEVSQRPAPILRLAGGLSQSDVLAQVVADVTGAEVVAASAPETSALGAALCAESAPRSSATSRPRWLRWAPHDGASYAGMEWRQRTSDCTGTGHAPYRLE